MAATSTVSALLILEYEERLPLLDDVRRELGGHAGADVPHRVHGLGRHGQRVAGAGRDRRLTVDVVLKRPLEDVDDLLARVLVPDVRRLRADLDAVLDDFASGDAEVVTLKIGAP